MACCPSSRRSWRRFAGRINPVSIAALSTPRGNGKSWLAGALISRALTPNDPLHENGVENVLVAASRAQAAIVLDFARQFLADEDGYRWRINGVEHLASRARVKVISSDSRRAMGLGANVRLAVCDEPGSWAPQSGRRLWEAVTGAIGKRRMTVIAIGTLAPSALQGPGAWWPDLVKSGSGDARHVALLQADEAKWKDFEEVLRCNPVAAVNPHLRRTLERTGGAGERTGGADFPAVPPQYPRRSGRSTTARHLRGVGAGLCSPGP